jgi:hypothetical protein
MDFFTQYDRIYTSLKKFYQKLVQTRVIITYLLVNWYSWKSILAEHERGRERERGGERERERERELLKIFNCLIVA